MGQALLAGSKALMLFQYSHEQMVGHKVGDLKRALAAVRAVGHIVREGDVGALAFATSASLNRQVMAETIRSPEQLLVAIVNTNANGRAARPPSPGPAFVWSLTPLSPSTPPSPSLQLLQLAVPHRPLQALVLFQVHDRDTYARPGLGTRR